MDKKMMEASPAKQREYARLMYEAQTQANEAIAKGAKKKGKKK